MKPLRLTDLAAHYSPSGEMEGTATGVAYDSRKVKPGDLFVALVGEKTDGHQYLEQAFRQGAAAAVVQHLPAALKKPLLRAEDTRLALADLSARLHDHPSRSMKVVGVTGTNGKTTTTHMLEGIFRAQGKRAGVIGTLGSHFEGKEIPTHHTTPQALELQGIFAAMREEGIQGVAMEVSSHALDQDRVAWTDFDVAVWTNLTRDHLDYHQTMEQYAQAKAKLFRGLAGASPEWGVVNRDDPAWETFMGLCPRTMTYGLSEADVRAEGVRLLPDGSQWTLSTPKGQVEIRLRLPGQFNVYNALAAASAGLALGIDLPTIAQGLNSLGGVAGRVEVVSPSAHPFTVLVDYAHTPDGLENVLRTARGFTQNRLIAVFGCGGDRDRTKRPIMGKLGTTLADVAFLTSDNPRTEDPDGILREIAAGAEGEYRMIKDRAEAIKAAISEAQPGDVVVIAGKGHEDYQIFKDKTIHFDDREEARKALGCSI